jgi:shikimate dehydrogenase
MLEILSGETLLYPILGDPVTFVKSPRRLTEQFVARNHNGICVPMQVPAGIWKAFCMVSALCPTFAVF